MGRKSEWPRKGVDSRRVEELTEEHVDYTVKTNLYGYFYIAQACVEHMQSGAAILNTGSVTGLLGNKDFIDYATTKGEYVYTLPGQHSGRTRKKSPNLEVARR